MTTVNQAPTHQRYAHIIDAALHQLNKNQATKYICLKTDVLSEVTRRNLLLRLHLLKGQVEKTVILKMYKTNEQEGNKQTIPQGFMNEMAALQFLNINSNKKKTIPKYGGHCETNHFILLEDMGSQHISLVDTLTGTSKEQAIQSLEAFMLTLGQFHGLGFGKIDQYEHIRKQLAPNDSHCHKEPVDLIDCLQKTHDLLGINLEQEVINEAQGLIHALNEPHPFTTLIHGDICPDNLFWDDTSQKVCLIDFEWSRPGCAFLDAVYLRMSMPTCWCAKAIPDNIIDHVETIYRQQLFQTIPHARDDNIYWKYYTMACGYWVLRTILLLNDVLEKDDIWTSGPTPSDSQWKPDENLVRPRILSRLQDFCRVAQRHGLLPLMTETSETILSELMKSWADNKPLCLYHVFLAHH